MIKKLYWKNQKDIKHIIRELQDNHVVISSTDTIYGFLGDVTQHVYDSICQMKEVAQNRPFLILVSQENIINKISKFIDISSLDQKTLKFITACWPGPATFIFKGKTGASGFLSSNTGTIALRCPEHEGLQNVLKHFNGLFSTSANKSTKQAPQKFTDISQDILEKINYVIVDKQEYESVNASTIVNLSNPDYSQEFPFSIIRDGAFPVSKLQEIYKNL